MNFFRKCWFQLIAAFLLFVPVVMACSCPARPPAGYWDGNELFWSSNYKIFFIFWGISLLFLIPAAILYFKRRFSLIFFILTSLILILFVVLIVHNNVLAQSDYYIDFGCDCGPDAPVRYDIFRAPWIFVYMNEYWTLVTLFLAEGLQILTKLKLRKNN